MSDMLQDGLAYYADVCADHASQQATYQRGAGDALQEATIPVTWGTALSEEDDGSGVIDGFELREILIRATDLVLGGVQVEPVDDDRIVSNGLTYVVKMPPAQAAIQHDGYRSQWHVHAWRRKAEA